MNSPSSPNNAPGTNGILTRLDAIVEHLEQLTVEVQGLHQEVKASAILSAEASPVKQEEKAAKPSAAAVEQEVTSVPAAKEPESLESDKQVVDPEPKSEPKREPVPLIGIVSSKKKSDADIPSSPYAGRYAQTEESRSSLPVYGAKSGSATDSTESSSQLIPQDPWWKDDKKLVRVIASFGVLITLLGVGFLVAVAIAAGLFPPSAQMGAATLLGIGLGVGAWKAKERQVAPPAVIALALTAMGTLILTGYGFTHYISLISAMITYPAMTVIAAIPQYFARRWNLPWLAGAAMVLSLVLVFPAITTEPNLAPWPAVAIVAIIFAASKIEPEWDNVVKAAAGLGTLALFAGFADPITAIGSAGPTDLFYWVALGYCAVLPAVMVVVLHRATRARVQCEGKSAQADDSDGLPESKLSREIMEYLPLAPMLFAAFAITATGSLLVTVLIGVATLIAIALSPQRLVSAAAALIAGVMATWHLSNSSDSTYLVAVVVFMVAAIASFYLPRSIYQHTEISMWAWLGTAVMVCVPFIRTITGVSSQYTDSAVSIVVGLVVMAFVLNIYMGKHEGLATLKNNVTVGVIALFLAITGFIFVFISFGDTGFRLGHALVSFALIALGAYLLVVRSHDAPAGAGAMLVVVAIGKLIFFDMASIDGIIRTLAFIGSGVLLLGIAVARGKYKGDDQPDHGSTDPDVRDMPAKVGVSSAQVENNEGTQKPTFGQDFDVTDNPYRNQ